MATESTVTGFNLLMKGIAPLNGIASPKNVKEQRSLLGSQNYYSIFISDFQGRCPSLYKLLQKGSKWKWASEEEQIISSIKESITADKTLVHYDETLLLILSTDASKKGVGALLQHRYPDGTLYPTETNLSRL